MAEPDSADADYQRVAIACRQLHAEGSYPSVRNVQRILREQLGGGIKTGRIAALIRRWEIEAQSGDKPSETPPPPSLDAVFATHGDLRPAIEALAAALAGMLEARRRQDADERVHAVQSAVDLAREQTAQHLRDVEAAHAAALDERETVIANLRTQEATQVEEIDRLEAALADQAHAMEAMRQELALATDDLRQTARRAEASAAELAQAEERMRALPRLEADLPAARQSLAVAEETRRQMVALVDGLRADLQAERAKSDGLHERIERLVGDLASAIARGSDDERLADMRRGDELPVQNPTSGGGNGSGASA